MNELNLKLLQTALQGTGAAFRSVTEYQPVGGPGDKVFPPTYEGGNYAEETRVFGEERVPCVLLDSVQSQANRHELALLDAWDRGDIKLPVITVDFAGFDLPKTIRVTSLEAPHRIADAILRDSLYREPDGREETFRQSSVGRVLDWVDLRNATPLFELCPTALLFGMWDSTGPRGGLGAKFQRAMVSEFVGVNAQVGVRTSSRIDPLGIELRAGKIYESKQGGWTLNEEDARREKNKAKVVGNTGRPSEVNHGNVTPSINDGGYTISRALQSTVISLPALRRLRFPLDNNGKSDPGVNATAQTTLLALGLYAAALVCEQGADLRSRCLLHATSPVEWELLDKPGETPARYPLTASTARDLLQSAVEEAKAIGLPWREEEINLKPSDELVELVRRSQKLKAAEDTEVETG
ncbi:MAG: type I-G CRISPR-associated RAMP protein Csb1/Cas7g [Acidobacteriota bacterium]